MINKIAKRLAFGVAAAIVLTTAGGAAYAADQSEEQPVDILRSVAPEVVAESLDPVSSDSGLSYDTASGTVTVPDAAEDGVSIREDDGTTRTVELPLTDGARTVSDEAGIRVYQNDDNTKALVAVSADSMTVTTVLESADAPSRFDYDFSEYGGELRQADDGGITIWEGDTPIGYFENPWAYDANGVEVPTHYEVSGSTLVQVVDHEAGDFAYPIAADPTYTFPGSNSLYAQIVEDRNASTGAVIIRVYTMPAPFTSLPRSTIISYYNQIVPAAYERNNLWDQLACHAYNATFKSPWNLETWRPDVGYPATVAALCNP